MGVTKALARNVQQYIRQNHPDANVRSIDHGTATKVAAELKISVAQVMASCRLKLEHSVEVGESVRAGTKGQRAQLQQAGLQDGANPNATALVGARQSALQESDRTRQLPPLPFDGPCLTIKPPPSKPCLSMRPPPTGPCLSMRPPPVRPCLSMRPPVEPPPGPPAGACLSMRPPPVRPCLSMRPPVEPPPGPPAGACLSMRPPRGSDDE